MILARRKFLTGLIAAPLVVSYQNIMPVKLFVPEVPSGVLIPLIRSKFDGTIFDLLGTQKMTGPIGLISSLKTKYE